MRTHVFSRVTVELTSNVRGSEAEEEWQEVDWVPLSTGDLEVDAEGFLLVFKPSSGTVKPMLLGSLLRGSPVAEKSRTLMITTSDSLHRLLRLTFTDERSVTDFSTLAAQAQAANNRQAAESDGDAARVSQVSEDMKLLQQGVSKVLEDRCPLVFPGVDLIGPDPEGEPGAEALIGSGLMVLLDPPEEADGRIGKYELLFFTTDQGSAEPRVRFIIGPKASLKRLQDDGDTEPLVSFSLSEGIPGAPGYTISFDSPSAGAGFSRDFRVRHSLMAVASKTVKGKRVAGELKAEIALLQGRSCPAVARAWAVRAVLALLLAAVARLVMLFVADRGVGGTRPWGEHADVVMQEAVAVGQLAWSGATAVGSEACSRICGAAGATGAGTRTGASL